MGSNDAVHLPHFTPAKSRNTKNTMKRTSVRPDVRKKKKRKHEVSLPLEGSTVTSTATRLWTRVMSLEETPNFPPPGMSPFRAAATSAEERFAKAEMLWRVSSPRRYRTRRTVSQASALECVYSPRPEKGKRTDRYS